VTETATESMTQRWLWQMQNCLPSLDMTDLVESHTKKTDKVFR